MGANKLIRVRTTQCGQVMISEVKLSEVKTLTRIRPMGSTATQCGKVTTTTTTTTTYWGQEEKIMTIMTSRIGSIGPILSNSFNCLKKREENPLLEEKREENPEENPVLEGRSPSSNLK